MSPDQRIEVTSARERIERLHPVARAILLDRNGGDLDQAASFLAGAPPHDPELLPDLAAAADYLADLPAGTPISIHGDYDVDGTSGSAILFLAMSACGLAPRACLPSRFCDGYGVSARQVTSALNEGTRTFVSVDCGVSCPDEVALVKRRGGRFIVTDHHEPRADGVLPPADWLIHPLLRPGYPYPHLCGSAVAYKLAVALCGRKGITVPPDLLGLAALGTVADVMPLTGENRDVVRVGLRRFAASTMPGIKEIIAISRPRGDLTASFFGFQIGPRINACGRLQDAMLAFELFTTRDPARAEILARTADDLNLQRRSLERLITTQAIEQHDLYHQGMPFVLVAAKDWHPGVIGVVAGRLAERYGVPAFVAHGPHDGKISGSARSGDGHGAYSVHSLLGDCAAVMNRWGGHAAAGGFELAAGRFEEFRARLHAALTTRRAESKPSLERPRREPPRLGLEQIDLHLVADLAQMEPFGRGNPEPRFSAVLTPSGVKPMGENGAHLSCTFSQGSSSIRAVGFSMGDRAAELAFGGKIMASFSLTINEFRGRRSPELRLHHFEKHEASE